jgi:hypothetical protein
LFDEADDPREVPHVNKWINFMEFLYPPFTLVSTLMKNPL